MANSKIYIVNGTDQFGIHTGCINISYDGVDWSTIPKAGLEVLVHKLNLDTTDPNDVNKHQDRGTFIVLKNAASISSYIRFKPTNVVNQSWAEDGLQAVEDINNWIAEIYP